MSYEEYRDRVAEDVRTCKEEMEVQPILFIGSGISQRYIGAPSWEQLLDMLCVNCPAISRPLSFYKQEYKNDNAKIGSLIATEYRRWAWDNQEDYPTELFSQDTSSDIYVKHSIATFFANHLEESDSQKTKSEWKDEIGLLANINPYAIITTNYDMLLESIFPEHTPIVGQAVIRNNFSSFGEIMKIHGCCTDPKSLVFTDEDYLDFSIKKKYLSAKLLTFFAEHPLFFFGYSAQDKNIRHLLNDIDEILSNNGELIPNIYVVEYDPDAESKGSHKVETLISLDHERSVRVKSITANSFAWIYKLIAEKQALERISPKILRSVLARTYDLVRYDIPKQKIEVDFQLLENAATKEGFSKLYGVTSIDNTPSELAIRYPYSLTQVGIELGFKGWHDARKIIQSIKDNLGVDIAGSDNRYHIIIPTGSKSEARKYSREAVTLLDQYRSGEIEKVEL